MKDIAAFIKKDKVFLIALIFAVISMVIIPPSKAYLGYINSKVLIVMFTLMIAVAGMYETHFFDFIATKLVIRFVSIKWIALVIILVTFFLGMFLTNDAVLLTLVPFTIFVTRHTKQEKYTIMIIILQTIAANMGSALTPMGDPQNIYLYAFYDIPFTDFLAATFPITIMGFILLISTTLIKIPHRSCELNLVAPQVSWDKVLLYSLFLINALLSILRIVELWTTLGVTIILALLYGRHLLKRVDYHLLLTFTAFFIFTGNLAQMDILQGLTSQFLNNQQSVYFTGLAFSQLISNVPAAVLLSTFTDRLYWQSLLQGVNVGSMGTIIGSLASLISFKYILKDDRGHLKTYLINYTVICLIYITIITVFLFII